MSTAEMKNATPLSKSAAASDAPTWLKEKVYGPKRQRTAHLVKLSVDTLRQKGNRVSLASITTKSKELDPEGRGVSESALLNNDEAYTYYKQHRSWNSAHHKFHWKGQRACEFPLPVKAGRDVARTRSRYFKMSKQDLVERLLATEQAYARQYELWLQLNDELLSFRPPFKLIQR
jgi:hypothetical protein